MSRFYKHDPVRWNEGTANLTLEQEAALLRICNAIYICDEPIRDNRFVLAGLFRCGTQKANRLLRDLIAAGKVFIIDGKIHNKRAEAELADRNLAPPVAPELPLSCPPVAQELPDSQPTDAPKPLKTNEPAIQNRIEQNRVIPSESHTAPAKGGKRTRRKKEPDPRFDLWFQTFITVYPKTEHQSSEFALRKAYGKAINRTEPDKINKQAAAYAAFVQADRTEPRFVASAVTWLEKERWNNDYSKSAGRQHNGNGAGPRKRSFDYLDDFERENGIVRDRDGGFTIVEPEGRESEDVRRDMQGFTVIPRKFEI
jgi:hypothetical protein